MQKYGLSLASKKTDRPAKPAGRIFEDEDEDESPRQSAEHQARIQGEKAKMSVQMQEEYAKALEEDPSIFDYDAAYDQIQEDRKRKQEEVVPSREPKYIRALKQKAEERKVERERAFERKLQKELEKEGDEFQDKERFVTQAYKEKILERRRKEEEERRKAAEEDVTQKKDMGDFYRNLYRNEAFGGRSQAESELAASKRTKLEPAVVEKPSAQPVKTTPAVAVPSLPVSIAPLDDKPAASEPVVSTQKEEPPVEVAQRAVNPEEAVKAARERYLARKKAQPSSKT